MTNLDYNQKKHGGVLINWSIANSTYFTLFILNIFRNTFVFKSNALFKKENRNKRQTAQRVKQKALSKQ